MKNTYCVIMAGGIGSRFWPISRTDRPKQFLDILGTGKSLIRQTYERFLELCPPENFMVVTSDSYKKMILEHIPELDDSQVLAEPQRRNTAPCIAYACNKIYRRNADSNVIIAPSDHLITREAEFVKQVKRGIDFVSENDVLLTLGISPHRPETGYGYIQINGKINFKNLDNLYKVKTFTEKPDRKMAEIFLESGEFFWNSGIFVWSVKSILNSFRKYLPDVGESFSRGSKYYDTSEEASFIRKVYSECRNISIDYGVMEHADNVYVLTADFGWSDLGTWGSLYENMERTTEGNVVKGDNVLAYNTHNSVISVPDNKLVVLQGLDGYIVVESDNTLLICRREDEQQLRTIVNDVEMKKGEKYI